MKYLFTHQVRILKEIFKCGIREVDEKFSAHQDFAHFVKAGWIRLPTEDELKSPVTVKGRAEKLRERMREQQTPAFHSDPVTPVEPPQKVEGDWESKSAEPVHEQTQESDPEEKLSPQQRAARTRKANAEKHEGVQGK